MQIDIHKAIGQLIIGKVQGKYLDDETKVSLEDGTIGGVTIFKENVGSQEELLNLIDDIHKYGGKDAFIAVDQEGGCVQRLDDVISPLPSMMALANIGDIERLKFILAVSAKQLKLLGINCVLAPVLDINTNAKNPIIGTRSFGSKPEIVAKFSEHAIKIYLEGGVLPVAKHFPGHGDTEIDSHFSLPKLSHDLERLNSIELVPFKENIFITPAILVAHLWLESLDQECIPATLSKNVIKGLLREDMGFQNLVISDDMLMKSITNNWGLTEACVQAIEAGVDLLLVCSNSKDAYDVHEALVDAVKNGRITEERIRTAYRAKKAALNKIQTDDLLLSKKRRLELLVNSVYAANNLMQESSLSAVSLVRGSLKNILSSKEKIHVFVPRIERYPLNICGELQKQYPEIYPDLLVEHRYSINPDEHEIENLLSRTAENCILLTFRATINTGQIRLAKLLAKQSKNNLLIATDVPYELDILTEWSNAIALYDPSNMAITALAKFINNANYCICGH